MEDEIDLLQYLEVPLRHWKWILALALAAAVVGLVVSLLLPETYEASSVVLVTQPRYRMQFDSRLQTSTGGTPAYKAFPSLARSDGVLQEVVNGYSPSPEAAIEQWKLRQLSSMTKASSGGDPSLVLLTVRSRSPQDAAAIANLWADVLVGWGNAIYGRSDQEVGFFEGQLAQTSETLDAADASLIEFETSNYTRIITAQLDSLLQTQVDYLGHQRTISYLAQDVRGLRDQHAAHPSDQTISLADELTALLLQIKAFNVQTEAPIQLQIDSREALSKKNLPEQMALLDDLVVTLQAKSAEIDARLEELEPQILALQQTLQESNVQHDRLLRDQELARETYLTLARKLDEAHIAAQEENGTLLVGSYAAVPEEPVSPRKKLIVVLAGVLGLMAGVFAAFAIEFWQRSRTPDPDEVQ